MQVNTAAVFADAQVPVLSHGSQHPDFHMLVLSMVHMVSCTLTRTQIMLAPCASLYINLIVHLALSAACCASLQAVLLMTPRLVSSGFMSSRWLGESAALYTFGTLNVLPSGPVLEVDLLHAKLCVVLVAPGACASKVYKSLVPLACGCRWDAGCCQHVATDLGRAAAASGLPPDKAIMVRRGEAHAC